MRFLVDAQLPVRLARLLNECGHDALHTSALPEGNRTTDEKIALVADADDRVVVTKDRDFRFGHLLDGSPRRLLVIGTGNVSNAVLLSLIETRLEILTDALTGADFVELLAEHIVIHPRGRVPDLEDR